MSATRSRIRKERWDKMYQQLVAYREKNGNCNVPQKYKQNKKALGEWVRTQRDKHEKKSLLQDRVAKLNGIGFLWERDWNVARKELSNERWNEMFQDLADYKEKKGHCNVPQRYKQNEKLGAWVSQQRKKHNTKKLLQDRIDKLNDIGFVWGADVKEEVNNEKWNEMFKDLVDYKEKEGHCNVPRRYPENPSLGNWVCKQRQKYKENLLSQDKIDKLQGIGFAWVLGRGSSRISQIEKQKAAELKAQYDNEKAGAKKKTVTESNATGNCCNELILNESSGDKKSDGAEDDNEEGSWLENEDNLSFEGVSSEVSSLESFKAQNISLQDADSFEDEAVKADKAEAISKRDALGMTMIKKGNSSGGTALQAERHQEEMEATCFSLHNDEVQLKLQEEIRKAMERMEASQLELSNEKIKSSELQESLEATKNELEEKLALIEEYQSKVSVAEEDVKQLNATTLQSKIAGLEQDMDVVKAENNALTEKMKDVMKDIAAKQVELETLQREKEEVSAQLTVSVEKESSLLEIFKLKEDEFSFKVKEAQEKVDALISEKVSAAENQIKELETERDANLKEIMELKQTINELKKRKAGTMYDEGDDEERMRNERRHQIESTVLKTKPKVKFDDVIGLEKAKESLKEKILYPRLQPQVFTGNMVPCKRLLLYGPPGTGKTYLAKAVATTADATFFNVSCADIMAKYFGQSEKLVSELFQTARKSKGSLAIIFIDEIDALCKSRSKFDNEASRGVVAEFLKQMDGIISDNDEDCDVMVLGATNTPWDIDAGILSRFTSRIYVAPPDREARLAMLKFYLGEDGNALAEKDYDKLAKYTDGASGRDIQALVRKALCDRYKETLFVRDGGIWRPCHDSDPVVAKRIKFEEVPKGKLSLPAVTVENFVRVMKKASISCVSERMLQRFETWTDFNGEDGD